MWRCQNGILLRHQDAEIWNTHNWCANSVPSSIVKIWGFPFSPPTDHIQQSWLCVPPIPIAFTFSAIIKKGRGWSVCPCNARFPQSLWYLHERYIAPYLATPCANIIVFPGPFYRRYIGHFFSYNFYYWYSLLLPYKHCLHTIRAIVRSWWNLYPTTLGHACIFHQK